MAKKAVLTETQIERAKNLYTVHQKSLQVIAQDLGVSVPTLSRYLKLAGAVIRSKGRPKAPVVEPTVADLPAVVEFDNLPNIESKELELTTEGNSDRKLIVNSTPVFDFN